MKVFPFLLFLLSIAPFSQAIEKTLVPTAMPLPSQVTTIDCFGEGQKLKMEWISSPWLSHLTINERPIEMSGLQMVSDVEGNDTYAKQGILEFALGKAKEEKSAFSRDITLYNKTYKMSCLSTSEWKVVH